MAPPLGTPYIHYWLYDEQARRAIEMSDSDKIRLDGAEICVKLKAAYNQYTGRNVYPLDSDITVGSWYWEPGGVKEWLLFEELSAKPAGTSIGHILQTSPTNSFYWDGAEWKAWDSSTWNTEAEIAANISSFPATARKLRIVSRLKTTDKYVTPQLYGVRVSATIGAGFLDDIFHRSLVSLLKEQFRFFRDHVVRLVSADSYVDLVSDHAPEAALEIDDIAEAYNHTTDPDHETNIFSSYNPSTKRVTFTGAQAAGDLIWIVLYVAPVVGVAPPRQDYYEVERVPAVLIEGLDPDGGIVHARREIKDKVNGTALVLDQPYQADIDFTLRFLAADPTSIGRMLDAGFAFLRENPTILSAGFGELYNLAQAGRAVTTTSPNAEDLYSASLPVRVEKAYYWSGGEERYLVQDFIRTYKRMGEPIGVNVKR